MRGGGEAERLVPRPAGSSGAAELARLYAGLAVEEAGEVLGLPRATAYREWASARAWLMAALA